MPTPQSLPIQLHTSDYYQKAKALRKRVAWPGRAWALLFGAVIAVLAVLIRLCL